jgi:putative two-component system response regulator
MSSISRFHLLLKSMPDVVDSDVHIALTEVAKEIKERLAMAAAGNVEYFQEVVRTIRAMSGDADAPLRVSCLLDACQFFYVSGQPFMAVEPATDAIELARRANDPALLRRALNGLGIVSADTGNISKAVECYAEALDISKSMHDLDAECASWSNIAAAWFYAAQYQESIGCGERVLAIAEANPALARYKAAAYANIALCCLHIEDFERGLLAAKQSIAESPEPKTSSEMLARVLRENNYARLLLEVNSTEAARERCDIARAYAQKSNSPRAEIVALVLDGLCNVHAGNIDLGLSRLLKTLEKARELKATLRDALIAMVKAYQLVGKPEKALIYLHELMEYNKHSQQRNTLQHNAIHLQRLGRSIESDKISARTIEKQEAILREQVAQKELIRAEAEIEVAFAEKNYARRQLVRSHIEMLERMAVTAELRDDSTGEHSYRVGKLASLLAHEYGCDDDTCFMVEIAGRLHDIGKIGVPDAVLLKPGKLNEAELQVMRTHPIVGAELLSKSETPHVQMAEEVARYHHEWWDGSGYPGHLAGTDIPLSARITALADVFDALTHKRPYKDAWSIELALEEIARQSGTQFDPQLTGMFVDLVKQLQAQHANLDAYLGQAAKNTPFKQARSKIQDALHGGRVAEATTEAPTANGRGSDSRLDLQR